MNLTVLPVILLFVVAGFHGVRLSGRVNLILIQRHPTTWRRLQDHPFPKHAIATFIRQRHDLRLKDPDLSYAVERLRSGSRTLLATMVVLLATYGMLLKLFFPARG
jgi:hypothetical protein